MLPQSPKPEPLGPLGEELVAREYARRGATVLARNFRCREGELDLVIRDRDGLAAVEVKTRTVNSAGAFPAGRPAESVTATRLTRLGRALETYRESHPQSGSALRIDVAEVVVDSTRRLRELRILTNVTG